MIKLKKKWWLGIFAFALILGASAVYTLLPKRGIPVLMYHFILPDAEVVTGKSSLNVSITNFERQMKLLKSKFRPISVDEYDAIQTGASQPKGREVLVTFDDGHRSYLQYALPILERYQIPSVNFLIWEHMNDKFWKDYMTLEEVKQISNHPLVTFGSHTISHPNLKEISKEEAWIEIKESKIKLEEFWGRPVHYFCYPGGSFNEEIIKLVQQAEYRLAFRTSLKPGYPVTLYSISRVKVRDKDNLLAFWVHAAGFTGMVRSAGVYLRELTDNKGNDTLQSSERSAKTM